MRGAKFRTGNVPPAPAREVFDDGYLTMKKLVVYSSLSMATLRKLLTDPVHPLVHYKPRGGVILVRKCDFDAWLERTRVTDGGKGQMDLDALVDDCVAGLSR